MRLRRALLLAAVLLAVSALAGVAEPRFGRAASPTAGTITVTGTGTVTTVPDRASFNFGVVTHAATAAAALAGASQTAAAVSAAVKKAGVSSDDTQTSQVYLSPQTNDNGTQILGYTASSTLTVQTALARAGGVVDTAVAAGATSVDGPGLAPADQDALYRKALRNAVADATEKAKALAAAAGVALGDVQTIAEGSGPTPLPAQYRAAALSDATSIEPGTQEIDATVTVTFAAS